MTDADDIRAVWDVEELRGLWNKAREVLEASEPAATFRLELPDERTRQAVGEVYGRPMWGWGTRISVSKLDAALRENTRFGLGLAQVLEVLHGRPVTRGESTSSPLDERRDRVTDTVRSSLVAEELDEASWAKPWSDWLHQYGRVAEDQINTTIGHAAAVLARLVLDPDSRPSTWASRADLAARFGGGEHQLDTGMTLSRIVLRAAALAHGVDAPSSERERRALWERCGVTLDDVSATVLCWSLPLVGSDDWSRAMDQRTSIGVPSHLTHLDLRAAPGRLVESGTTIAVCENPRVLEAAVRAEIRHPLLCLSGQPTTVAVQLLRRLVADGAVMRYHGDFDWAGMTIAHSMWAGHGFPLWRMSSSDYREALNLASAGRLDVPTLVGTPVETPWDRELSELMATAGRAVEEEVMLPVLLDDLRHGLP